jgi:hypothetical protein
MTAGQNQFSDQEFLNQSPDLLGRQSGNRAFSGREDTDSRYESRAYHRDALWHLQLFAKADDDA